jgi:predicted phosphodiesterase
LLPFAKQIQQKNPSLKLITFGHTHTSEMKVVAGDCWYLNSGAWIPNIEINTNKIQDTNTFCVLRLLNINGVLKREPLLRWNDARDELERMIFVKE